MLEQFDVLDTRPEERFDRITRMAARCFNVPIAVISLVADTRQWFKSAVGLDASETSREVSFCGHAILAPETLVVLDAAQDRRFHDTPLVTGQLGIRFYAGAPLVSAKGFRFGTLCLIDHHPHEVFDEQDRTMLADFSAMVIDELYRCGGDARALAESLPDGPSDWSPDESSESQGRPNSRVGRLKVERDLAQKAQLLFVASLSHELRTPLNAIKGFSEVLSRQEFGPIANSRYLEYAGHIRDSACHLSAFVDSILDFVKAEQGEIALHEDRVDVAGAVRKCLEMFTERLRANDMRLVWTAPADLPTLKADPQLIVQMLVNLIGNSIKFSAPGDTIEIAGGLRDDGGLSLSVRDCGIGIAQEDQKKVILPFGQVDNAQTRRHGGTGLGLSLTGQFMALHGGDLALDSTPGEGTTVYLHFPAYRIA